MSGTPLSSEGPVVSQENRHLKWRMLDPLEFVLMCAGGALLGIFTTSVFLDVLLRTLGNPVLLLPEITLGAFIWGIFIGAAVALRRNQHFYMSAVTKSMTGRKRWLAEVVNHLALLTITLSIAYFGYLNFLNSFGVSLAVSESSTAILTAAIPVFGVLTTLFTVEVLVNGWRNGFEGIVGEMPEQVSDDEEQRS
ncbi:MAG: TRAP transporter small permease [Rubrobacteraceae bacterium]